MHPYALHRSIKIKSGLVLIFVKRLAINSCYITFCKDVLPRHLNETCGAFINLQVYCI